MCSVWQQLQVLWVWLEKGLVSEPLMPPQVPMVLHLQQEVVTDCVGLAAEHFGAASAGSSFQTEGGNKCTKT